MFKDITPLLWGSNISILKSLKEQIVSGSVIFFLGNCCLKTELLREGGEGEGEGEHSLQFKTMLKPGFPPNNWPALIFLINILILKIIED